MAAAETTPASKTATSATAAKEIWTRVTSSSGVGPGPAPRCAHSACLHRGSVLVFGGWNGQRMLNDVWALDCGALRWRCVDTHGKPPSPRAGHSAVVVGGSRLVVFGGGDGSAYLNDVHVLDLDACVWTQGYTTGATTPCARSRHAACAAGAKTMLVIGGGDDSRVYNDVYALDCAAMVWTRLSAGVGAHLTPRWGHSAVPLDAEGSRVLVCGGHDGSAMLADLHCFDVASAAWAPAALAHDTPSSASGPTPRAGHTMCAMGGGAFVLFGGGDGKKVLNDVHFLEEVQQPSQQQKTFRWLHPPSAPNAPTGRCAHTAVVTDDAQMLVFGGGDGARRFKEVYIFDAARVLREARAQLSFLQQQQQSKQQEQKQQQQPPPPPAPPPQQQKPKHPPPPSLELPGAHPSKVASMQSPPLTSPSVQRARELSHNTADVGAFLHSLGLGGYVAAFIREDITLDVLPMLGERHLEAMGISSLGVRLRILGAIRRTYGHMSTSSSAVSIAAAAAAATAPPPSPGSRSPSASDMHASMLIAATERLERATLALTEAVATLTSNLKVPPLSSSPQPSPPPPPSEPQAAPPQPVEDAKQQPPQRKEPKEQPPQLEEQQAQQVQQQQQQQQPDQEDLAQQDERVRKLREKRKQKRLNKIKKKRAADSAQQGSTPPPSDLPYPIERPPSSAGESSSTSPEPAEQQPKPQPPLCVACVSSAAESK